MAHELPELESWSSRDLVLGTFWRCTKTLASYQRDLLARIRLYLILCHQFAIRGPPVLPGAAAHLYMPAMFIPGALPASSASHVVVPRARLENLNFQLHRLGDMLDNMLLEAETPSPRQLQAAPRQLHVLRVLAQRQLHGARTIAGVEDDRRSRGPNARTIAGVDLDVARVFGPHVLMFRGLHATHLEQRRRCHLKAPRQSRSLSSQPYLGPSTLG